MNQSILLTDPGTALQIDFSAGAMETIRERARAGLLAVPRVPVGSGGLLVGTREGNRIRILDSIDIPCSHSAGPDFKLTPEETEQCAEMLADAGSADADGKVTVVGWYCSKTRGDGELSPDDEAFHRRFFPELWHVAMVVRPTTLAPVHVTFFQRNPAGSMTRSLDRFVDPRHPQNDPIPTPAREAPPAPKPVKPAAVRPAEKRKPSTSTVGLFGVPGLEPPRPRKRRRSLTPILVTAAVLAVLAVAALFTQDYWMPRPPLTMSSSLSNGVLTVRWNAAALRGFNHAVMYINDGGVLLNTNLGPIEINAGTYDYTPKSQRVTARLDAGAITGMTAWFATPPPAPTAVPPSATEPAPAPIPK